MQRKQVQNRRLTGMVQKSWILLCTSVLLSGCHKHTADTSAIPRTLPYKVEVASDSAAIYLQKKLQKQHVQVITMGQDYLVSIPSSVLFPDESPQLTWSSYKLLNDVACYLQQFRMVAVNITGYGVCYMSDQRERALTLARAKAVSNYLWSQGIDSRFIFTEGLGSDKPIIGTAKAVDTSPNSRIEITFRHIVA